MVAFIRQLAEEAYACGGASSSARSRRGPGLDDEERSTSTMALRETVSKAFLRSTHRPHVGRPAATRRNQLPLWRRRLLSALPDSLVQGRPLSGGLFSAATVAVRGHCIHLPLPPSPSHLPTLHPPLPRAAPRSVGSRPRSKGRGAAARSSPQPRSHPPPRSRTGRRRGLPPHLPRLRHPR